jgi:hypothetical protein
VTVRERILRDLPAAAAIAVLSLVLGQVVLNGWLWFAALMGAYYVGREIQA